MTTATNPITPTTYATKQILFNRMARALSPQPGHVTGIQLDASGNFMTTNLAELKRCTKCNYTKPIEDFYKNAKSPDTFETACKTCRDAQ